MDPLAQPFQRDIRRFLSENPSLSQVLEYIEKEAQRIVEEQRRARKVEE